MNASAPIISIIMPCYNAENFLAAAIQSVVDQSFGNWELKVVNDGSTDNSERIAREFEAKDSRIKVLNKENGGYVSARLFGLRSISPGSRYLHFFDADDILHPTMLSSLIEPLENDPKLGAVYCNHMVIDAKGNSIGLPQYGGRLNLTLFGVRKVPEGNFYTSFISIFSWATRMIEPMTIIRRKAYEESFGWDDRFGHGKGNIGEGVLLFSEIALKWKVGYLNEPLYYYRLHPNQATAKPELNRKAGGRVISVWNERVQASFPYSRDIKAAIIATRFRIDPFRQLGSVKHLLRHHPLEGILLIAEIGFKYIHSLQLLFYRDSKVFESPKEIS